VKSDRWGKKLKATRRDVESRKDVDEELCELGSECEMMKSVSVRACDEANGQRLGGSLKHATEI